MREPPAAVTGQRILLADDNADLRDYVRRLLEVNYEVEAVEDGVRRWRRRAHVRPI
jgi:CheY-like chemotaxis protein